MTKTKKRVMRIIAAIVTISSIYIFAPWQAALYYFYPLPLTVQAQMDEAIEKNLDGIILYIDKKGQAPELYASGWHNRDKKIPAYPNALFKIASIGKLFDAATITKLVAQNRLSLDETLAYYLPSLVGRIENAEKITLRMMIQHRSGIPNYTDHDDFSWDEVLGGDDSLALILDTPASFKPNSDYGYSNTNYLLLRKIVSKTLEKNHAQFIKDYILLPLELKQTYSSVNNINIDKLTSGYHVGYDLDFKALDQGYISTAENVGIFLRALNDGSLFTNKEREIYASLYKFNHDGWVLGYSSIARYHKDIDTVVIQFVNTTGDNTIVLTNVIYNRVMEILRMRDQKT